MKTNMRIRDATAKLDAIKRAPNGEDVGVTAGLRGMTQPHVQAQRSSKLESWDATTRTAGPQVERFSDPDQQAVFSSGYAIKPKPIAISAPVAPKNKFPVNRPQIDPKTGKDKIGRTLVVELQGKKAWEKV